MKLKRMKAAGRKIDAETQKEIDTCEHAADEANLGLARKMEGGREGRRVIKRESCGITIISRSHVIFTGLG